MSTTGRSRLAQRAADWMHEASVLIGVFALLDKVLRGELTVGWTFGAAVMAVALFVLGSVIDARLKE